jgi:hypothetical protein
MHHGPRHTIVTNPRASSPARNDPSPADGTTIGVKHSPRGPYTGVTDLSPLGLMAKRIELASELLESNTHEVGVT